MGLDPRGVFGDWAQNELAARQMDELEKRIKNWMLQQIKFIKK
jgi:hypothetical protein